jgi:sucrose-6-phosphate hydrolase SacC (GH32 family)
MLQPALRDPQEGWTSLYNGSDLSQWRILGRSSTTVSPTDWETPRLLFLDSENPAELVRFPYPSPVSQPSPDKPAPAFANSTRGRSPDLITAAEYGDIELYVEYVVPLRSNSGVCVMGLYEIQIFDSYGKTQLDYTDDAGIYARRVDGRRIEGAPPDINVSRPPGAWQSLHIWFRAPRFDAQGKKIENARFLRVEHNGAVVHQNFELTGSTRFTSPWEERAKAPLLLQGDHGGVAFRNIYVRPLQPGR